MCGTPKKPMKYQPACDSYSPASVNPPPITSKNDANVPYKIAICHGLTDLPTDFNQAYPPAIINICAIPKIIQYKLLIITTPGNMMLPPILFINLLNYAFLLGVCIETRRTAELSSECTLNVHDERVRGTTTYQSKIQQKISAFRRIPNQPLYP